MSKESRRAARLARESRQSGGAGRPPTSDTGAGPAGDPRGDGGSPTRRPVTGTGPRAGRRERVRSAPPPTFFERYRNLIVGIAAVAIVALAVGYVFIGSTSASYTCGSQFSPAPTPTVSPGSDTRLGFFQDDMGAQHAVSPGQKYLLCPPASGNHYNVSGVGPIQPRVYKPDDKIGPPNWIHNLEHGALVVLYRNDSPGATPDGQRAFTDYFNGFPASPVCQLPAGQISPVIARFDDMPHPYALLVWDRVMYLDSWDPALATAFFLQESERLDATGVLNHVNPPEPQCVGPSAIPGASAPAASGSVAPASAAPSAAPSDAASAAPSAAPSANPAAS